MGNFIAGIDYPKELLKNRVTVEANVIACIYKDPLLLEEHNIEKEDLITQDARFLFAIASRLHKLNISVFDEVSIISNLTDTIKEKFDEIGGYEAIELMCSCININNADGYFDALYKSNIILGLYNDGNDLFRNVEFNGKEIQVLKLYEKLTAQEVLDHRELLLSRFKVSNDACVLDETDIDFENFVESCESGELTGVPFSNCGTNKEGKTIDTFKFISDETQGLLRKGTNIIAGFSSVGKSSMMMEISLSLATAGEKILVISNEEGVKKFKLKIMAFLLYRYCRYAKCTIKKMMKGIFTEEDKTYIDIVKTIWKERFQQSFKFIEIASPNISVIKKKVRDYSLKYGFSTVIYDVLKLEDCSGTSRSDLQIQEMTRVFDNLAKQYDLICILTMQCATMYKNRLFLTNEVLSDAKNAKDIMENLIIIRDCFPDVEFDKKSKYFCRPYRLEKDEITGKWREIEYEPDPKKVYKMVFLDKCRSGENSSSSGKAYLLEFRGENCTFVEVAMCRPAHANIY